MDYQFTIKPIAYTDGGRYSGYTLESILPFVGGGITVFEKQFFFDLYLQKAFSGSDETSNFYEGDSDSSRTSNEKINSDFERDELSLSVGYAVGNQGALFLGYRRSTTNFIDIFTKTGTYSNNSVFTENGTRDIGLKQSGYFLGGAYAFPISEQTAITLNAALAFLDGEYDVRFLSVRVSSTNDSEETDDDAARYDGDTVGLNLGVSWKGRMFESVDYTLGLDGSSYDFDFENRDEFESIETTPKISESVIRLSAGLSYQF
ncbi:MAG: hypothetical protein DSZ28_00275 [Thiothrix sp.]|nr:MAG: hypothetical protein DSZ28_00275 [Thiothrix sp.]